MKKVFFLTTVFAIVISFLLFSSCSHASSGGGSSYYGTSSSTNDNCAGKLNAYFFTGTVTEVVNFLTYTVNSDDYKCDCGENCTCCITEIKIKVVDEEEEADIGSLVNALKNVPEDKTVYLDIYCTYINVSNVFSECTTLSGIVLASHQTKIEQKAFYNCLSLKTVVFGTSLAVIEPNAFSGCTNLATVTFATKNWVVSNNAKTDSTDPSKSYNLHEVSVEDASKAASLLKEGTTASMYWYSIGSDTNFTKEGLSTDISSHYFKGTVAEAVAYIESLSSVTDTTNYVYFVSIVDSSETSTTNLRNALRNLSATENTGPYVSLDLTETKLSIDSFAFQGTSSPNPSYALREVKLPENCTSMGDYAFSLQAGLQNVVFPASLTSIGDYAFWSCKALETVDMSQCTKLQSIGDYAFCNCSALTEVDLSGCTKLESIGGYAFEYCSSLTTVGDKLPASLTSIGNHAFEKCSALTKVDMSGCIALQSIGSDVFYFCSSLTDLGNDNKLPASLTSIGNEAFYNCSSLTTVDMTACAALESIGGYAFYYCSSLTEIKIEKTEGMAWGHPSSTDKESTPSQSNLTMVTDFEEAPVYYLTGTKASGEDLKTTLSDGYKYYWYKVEYTEDNP